jgi:hypothetical protein
MENAKMTKPSMQDQPSGNPTLWTATARRWTLDSPEQKLDGSSGNVWVGVDVLVIGGADNPDVLKVGTLILDSLGYDDCVVDGRIPKHSRCLVSLQDCVYAGVTVVDLILRLKALPRREHVTLDLPVYDEEDMEDGPYGCFGVVEEPGLNGMALMGVPDHAKAKLEKAGYGFCVAPLTDADLLSSSRVILTEEFVEKVMGGKDACDQVLCSLKASSKVLRSAAVRNYVLFTALS